MMAGSRCVEIDGEVPPDAPAPPQARLLAQLVRHRFELVHHALAADEQGAAPTDEYNG